MKKRSLNTHLNEETVTKYLSQLDTEELREILFEVFQNQGPNNSDPTCTANFFLGVAWRDNVAPKGWPRKWGEAELMAVACIDREVNPSSLGPDWGFCQYGTCPRCDIHVCSNYKDGLCPICFGKVRMT